jgi:hypothetical protein
MTTRWSEAQVLALTNDTPTLQNGRKLAAPGKWLNTGGSDDAVWGECQGSGKAPYRVGIDRTDMAYKCTCPSHKFPCKHTIALFLLFANHPDVFSAQTSLPNWLTTWLEGRQKRREKPELAAADQPLDTEAQAKRQEAREDKVRAGIVDLSRWLRDLIRHGVADDRLKTYAFWDHMAARMVDAQASGIARRLRTLGGLPFQGHLDWATRMLDELGRLYLLCESYARIDSLPVETQHDVRTLIGWTYWQEELLTLPAVRDRWLVLGHYTEVEERLKIRRVWLHGKHSRRIALLLDFAHGGTPFEGSYPLGQSFDGEIIYYPGAYPQRAILKTRLGSMALAHDDLTCLIGDAEAAFDHYADAIAANPWLDMFPLGLRAVIPYQEGNRFFVRDSIGRTLPIRFQNGAWWTIVAASGGHPIAVFGEWDGYDLMLRTLHSDGIFFSI